MKLEEIDRIKKEIILLRRILTQVLKRNHGIWNELTKEEQDFIDQR